MMEKFYSLNFLRLQTFLTQNANNLLKDLAAEVDIATICILKMLVIHSKEAYKNKCMKNILSTRKKDDHQEVNLDQDEEAGQKVKKRDKAGAEAKINTETRAAAGIIQKENI